MTDLGVVLLRLERKIEDLSAGHKLRVYSTRGAAEYCGMNYGTFRNRVAAGTGPTQHKDGDSNAFYESDLDAWNESRLRPVGRDAEAVAS
ncbi:hypothetical protein ILP86_00850 [Microbacterium sp. R1]|uniref:helix-turn-helix transcriptional regulator n=1 Tax=Microbacterium sp. R1 TaxID=322686 RepID=UPI00187D250E|nr:hypothetical protein [Microbacterium sp. R1]MBE7952860.1 hypothetical protein [Microbacterium sp. R1]